LSSSHYTVQSYSNNKTDVSKKNSVERIFFLKGGALGNSASTFTKCVKIGGQLEKK